MVLGDVFELFTVLPAEGASVLISVMMSLTRWQLLAEDAWCTYKWTPRGCLITNLSTYTLQSLTFSVSSQGVLD